MLLLVRAAACVVAAAVLGACVEPSPPVGVRADLRESVVFDVAPFAGHLPEDGATRSVRTRVDIEPDEAPATLAALVRDLARLGVGWVHGNCPDGTIRVFGEEALTPGTAEVTIVLDPGAGELRVTIDAPREEGGSVYDGPPDTVLDGCPAPYAEALRTL